MINNPNQNPERSSTTSTNELPWLAFCYVANELDSQTRRDFEIRLEHDQSAREAVAHAFDNAWILEQALAAETNKLPATVCKLLPTTRSSSTQSKPAWPKVLLGIGIAGLLAMLLLQLRWKPAEVGVAKNTSAPTFSELTNTAVSLAETWADSDWDPELEAEIADIQADLPQAHQCDLKQDDWMTATLIDMADDLEAASHQSGS